MKERTIEEILRPTRRPQTIFCLNDFFTVVRNTYNMVNGDNWGSLLHADPLGINAESLNPPIITYKMAQKTPARLGTSRQIKPGIRTAGVDLQTQQKSTLFTQRFLYTVHFDIWESSWEKALEHGEKFEDFMLTYTGLFKELGVTEIIYAGATEEPARASWRTDLVAYKTVYDVYIERHINVLNKTIESIKVDLLGGEKTNG